MKKIYFFNGWGMDNKILSSVKNTSSYEVEIVNFPYNIEIKELLGYEDIIFIAWSFGVYYLNKFLNENKKLRYSRSIAINGLSETIGKYGINEKMFNLTLDTLDPERLLKFYDNMDIDEFFQKSSKNFEEIKYELEYFKKNYKLLKNIIDYSYIGSYDRIIPRAKQEKFYRENGVKYKIINCGHYPFSCLKDFKIIIEE
ncbi:MAG: DUF452 family protein [Fusobacterium sp.]|uniref:pimeloyl-ACP methyl esterase BioG family protein n=1 Tax=Fusobacterium sp. TaxID=68766 RepID=UPI0026DA71EA|nr:pimeloyl-ACP methyl esterase BioG family protein [Fusobacterium sp.]MDO4690903.1 DUF452 family protein [Fusobacterium sp.]